MSTRGTTESRPESPFEKSARDDRLSSDVELLQSLKWFRAELTRQLVGRSASTKEKDLQLLRLDTMQHFAEFYYLLDELGLKDASRFEDFVDRHNDYILSLSNDEEKMKRLGLDKERVMAALFDGNTRPRLIENWRMLTAMEQSNLARFLAPVMSTETTRQVVVACGSAGFLTRQKTVYGSMLVRSTGVMEEVCRSCLAGLRERLYDSIESRMI